MVEHGEKIFEFCGNTGSDFVLSPNLSLLPMETYRQHAYYVLHLVLQWRPDLEVWPYLKDKIILSITLSFVCDPRHRITVVGVPISRFSLLIGDLSSTPNLPESAQKAELPMSMNCWKQCDEGSSRSEWKRSGNAQPGVWRRPLSARDPQHVIEALTETRAARPCQTLDAPSA